MRNGLHNTLSRPTLPLIFLTTILLKVTADATNITIDDQYGDALTGALPTYTPSSGAWNQGANCTICFVKPDPSQVKDGTWHDATWSPGAPQAYTIDLLFNGSAIYVYGILANSVQGSITVTNLTFLLDGNPSGSFVHVPSDSTDYQYNVLLYGNSTLAPTLNSQHHLVINTVGTTNQSLILFDYALRTIDVNDTASNTTSLLTASSTFITPSASSVDSEGGSGQSSSHVSVAAIVGGIIGGVGGIAICLLVVFWLSRNERKTKNTKRWSHSSDQLMEIESYTMQQATVDPFSRKPLDDDRAPKLIRSVNGSSIDLLAAVPSNDRTPEDEALTSVHISTEGQLTDSRDAKRKKAAVNRAELARQVEEMQQAIMSLQIQLLPSRDEQPNTIENIPQVEQDLRRRIAILQNEVERLQANQEELLRGRNDMEAPPGYAEEYDI